MDKKELESARGLTPHQVNIEKVPILLVDYASSPAPHSPDLFASDQDVTMVQHDSTNDNSAFDVLPPSGEEHQPQQTQCC